MRKCWIGSVPSAGTVNGSGSSNTRSGVPIDQPCGNFGRARRLGKVARRRPLLDPGGEQGSLVLRQAAVVGEVAVSGIGVPGRHASIGDHLGDRGRPTSRLVKREERKRGDLAWTVARRASIMKNRGDIGGIGHRSARVAGRRLEERSRLAGWPPWAAKRGGSRAGWRFCGTVRSIGQPTTWVSSGETARPARTASIASLR